MHFPAIGKTKNKKKSFDTYHGATLQNSPNTIETKYLGGNGVRQKCKDKRLVIHNGPILTKKNKL